MLGASQVGFEVVDETRVDGGHGHEHGGAAFAPAGPDRGGVEFRVHFDGDAAEETGCEAVDDAVDVVEGEHVDQSVTGVVFPRFDQALRLEGDVLVCGYAALWVAGCAGGVDHEGAVVQE